MNVSSCGFKSHPPQTSEWTALHSKSPAYQPGFSFTALSFLLLTSNPGDLMLFFCSLASFRSLAPIFYLKNRSSFLPLLLLLAPNLRRFGAVLYGPSYRSITISFLNRKPLLPPAFPLSSNFQKSGTVFIEPPAAIL